MDNVIAGLKKIVAPWYKNLRGWRTDRKIVVIESDDWGSIRMPSKDVYEKCLKAGYHVDEIAYEKYDSLASEDDLELLFELLLSFRDKNGNPPIITANSLVANPDFDKIRASDFHEYHFETITETFERYPKHRRCFELWKEGMSQNIFFLQSHGREHLNVTKFLSALRNGDRDALFGFDNGMPGSIRKGKKGGNFYVESLKYSSEKDKYAKLNTILEGLNLFEKLFGYKSRSFIPPNYLWSPDFNEAVSKAGVLFYQGKQKMKEPFDNGENKIHRHYLGERNAFGQHYLVRNAVFEPSLQINSREKSFDQCLYQINSAFRMKKPAIICSHRLNYVGFLNENNRDINLKILKSLLHEILKRWPEVEFMASDKLGTIIKRNDSTENN